jgi:hypothetical protein
MNPTMNNQNDVVRFNFDVPVEVAMQFDGPKEIETEFGERAMYRLTDGRTMFTYMLTAAKIRSLGVKREEPFFVVKRKNGRRSEYEVWRESTEPDAAPLPAGTEELAPQESAVKEPASEEPARKAASVTRRPRGMIRFEPRKYCEVTDLERQLVDSIALAEHRKPAAAKDEHPVPAAPVERKPPEWAQTLLTQTNELVDCYAGALEHAAQRGVVVKPEDVRSLLVTAFIQLAQQKRHGLRVS